MRADSVVADAFRRHKKVLEESEAVLKDAARAAELLSKALKAGKKVIACGNGGSAADAEHFIGELVCRYKDDRRALPGISLVSGPALTAIGNDYAFDDIFARQVEALGEKDDVLVALSTSGSSKNVLKAIRTARNKKMKTIVLTGVKGKKLRGRADIVVAVPSEETARIQEMHELVCHGWCEFIDRALGIR